MKVGGVFFSACYCMVALSVFSLSSVWAQERPSRVLTLDRAIEIALEDSPAVQKSGQDVRIAQGLERQSGLWDNPQLFFQTEEWHRHPHHAQHLVEVPRQPCSDGRGFAGQQPTLPESRANVEPALESEVHWSSSRGLQQPSRSLADRLRLSRLLC